MNNQKHLIALEAKAIKNWARINEEIRLLNERLAILAISKKRIEATLKQIKREIDLNK